MALGMAEVIEKARFDLHELTGLEVSSTLGAMREDGEWRVTMEVLEKKSIPDGMDILATYETRLDAEGDGSMLNFKRTRMRRRIDTEEIEE